MHLLKIALRTAMLLAPFLLPAICQREGGSAATRNATTGEKARKLATRVLRVGTEERMLTLWRQELQRPSDSELLSYFSAHPEQGAFPNTAFLVVNSPSDNLSAGKLAWARYVYVDRGIRPEEIWSADLAHFGID
jgi:hypothetical protein